MPRLAKMDLTGRIEQLQTKREELQRELEVIDATLAQIRQLLGMGVRGRPVRAAASAASAPKAGRRRRKFAINGLDSVLNFVKANKGATTAEVNATWATEGRAGRADVTLGKLVADKKLKRVKLKEGRGSRYVVGVGSDSASYPRQRLRKFDFEGERG